MQLYPRLLRITSYLGCFTHRWGWTTSQRELHLLQLLREDGRTSLVPIPSRSGRPSCPNLPRTFLVLKLKLFLPRSSEHYIPRQTGMAGHTTVSQALNFCIWYLGREAFCLIYNINKITSLPVEMLPHQIWRLCLRQLAIKQRCLWSPAGRLSKEPRPRYSQKLHDN